MKRENETSQAGAPGTSETQRPSATGNKDAGGNHDEPTPEARAPEVTRHVPLKELMLGAAFGLAFGFFLQKGGVAKYHILVGALLLEDFTVLKVMGSAIITGMISVHILRRAGLISLQFKPTWYAANVTGGLIFGLGFGLSGYCPGTASAALGQGNFDALGTMAGLLAGSLFYAEISRPVEGSLRQWGHRGRLTLPELTNIPLWPFIAVFAVVLAALLGVLDMLD